MLLRPALSLPKIPGLKLLELWLFFSTLWPLDFGAGSFRAIASSWAFETSQEGTCCSHWLMKMVRISSFVIALPIENNLTSSYLKSSSIMLACFSY